VNVSLWKGRDVSVDVSPVQPMGPAVEEYRDSRLVAEPVLTLCLTNS